MHLARVLLAGLVGLVAGSACGDAPSGQETPAALQGPPLWRSVREEGPAQESKLALHCRTPCRTRFRLERSDGTVEVQPWRTLAAGQTIQVWWSVAEIPKELEVHLAHPGREEGRTEPVAANLEFQYGDRAFTSHRFVVWTRPGRGRLLHLEAVPPGAYDPLALPGALELATVAVTDLAAGRGELRRRTPLNRLVLPSPLPEGDRAQVLRLFLDLAPLE